MVARKVWGCRWHGAHSADAEEQERLRCFEGSNIKHDDRVGVEDAGKKEASF